MADGRIEIDTGLDTSGFSKGSEAMKRGLETLISSADRAGKTMGSGFQTVADKVQTFVQSVSKAGDVTDRLAFAQYVSQMQADMTRLMGSFSKLGGDVGKLGTEKGVQQFEFSLKTAGDALLVLLDRLEQLKSTSVETEEYAYLRGQIDLATSALDDLKKKEAELDTAGIDHRTARWKILQAQIEEATDDVARTLDDLKEFGTSDKSALGGSSDFAPKLQELDTAYHALFETYKQYTEQVQRASDALQKEAEAKQRAEAEAQRLAAAKEAESQRRQRLAEEEEEEAARAEAAAARKAAVLNALKSSFSALAGVVLGTVKTAFSVLFAVLKKVLSELPKFAGATFMAPFQALSTGARGLASALQATLSALGRMGEIGGKIASGFGSAVTAIAKGAAALFGFGKASKKAGNLADSLVHKLDGLKRMLVSRVKRMFISKVFSALKNAFNSLAKKSKEFNAALASMQNAANAMAGNFAAAFSGIITAIAPVITQIIHYVSTLLTYLNALFAVLSGKNTIMVAKEATDAYGKSAGRASKKTDELKKKIMGFDEINNIKKDNDSGGGGGGAGAIKYVEKTIDSVLPENVQAYFVRLKQAITDENWEEVGGLVASALNAGMQKIDGAILELEPKAIQWASNAARILNGVVDNFDFTLLGKTIGDGLNLIIRAENEFLKEFNAVELGKGIAEALNSLFDTVSWDELGELFGRKLNFYIDTLYGFINEFRFGAAGADFGKAVNSMFDTIEWEKLSKDFSSGVNGIIDLLEGFITQLEIGKEGRQKRISAAIRQMILDIDWTGAIRVFSNGVQFLIDWAAMLFANFPFAEWAGKLTEGINSLIENPNGTNESWSKINENIGTGIQNMIDGFAKLTDPKEGINFQDLGDNIGTGLRQIAAKVDFGEILLAVGRGFLGLWLAFTTGVASFSAILSVKATQIKNGINQLITEDTFSEVIHMTTVGIDGLIDAFANLVGAGDDGDSKGIDFDGIADNLANGVNTLITGASWDKLVHTIFKGGFRIKAAFWRWIRQINFVELAEKLASGLNDFIHDPSLDWGTLGNDLGTSFANFIQGLDVFLNDVDWGELGRKIGVLLANIPWGAIATQMWALFKDTLKKTFNLVEAISDTLTGDRSKIEKDAFTFMENPLSSAVKKMQDRASEFHIFGGNMFTKGFNGLGRESSKSFLDSFVADFEKARIEMSPREIKIAKETQKMWSPEEMRKLALLFSQGFEEELTKAGFSTNAIGLMFNDLITAKDIGAAQKAFEKFGLEISGAFIHSLNGKASDDIMAAIQMLLLGINEETISNIGIAGLKDNLEYYVKECGMSLEDAAIHLASTVGASAGEAVEDAMSQTLDATPAESEATEAGSGVIDAAIDGIDEKKEELTTTVQGVTDSVGETMQEGLEAQKEPVKDLTDELLDTVFSEYNELSPEQQAQAAAVMETAAVAIAAGLPEAQALVKTAAETLVGEVEAIMNGEKGQEIGQSFINGVGTGADMKSSAISAAGNAGKAIHAAFKTWVSENMGINLGAAIDLGIATGIRRYESSVTVAARNAAVAAYNAAMNAIKAHSPSRLFANVGKFSMLGWAKGEEDNADAVLDTIATTTRAMEREAEDTRLSVVDNHMISGLDMAIDRLSEIATIFTSIGDMLARVGDLPIPALAEGYTIPYRTRIDASQVDFSGVAQATPDAVTNEGLAETLTRILPGILESVLSSRPIELSLNGTKMLNWINTQNRYGERARGV